MWFGREVILPVCGNGLLVELPADHRAGGEGSSLLPVCRLHGHITIFLAVRGLLYSWK